jgi:uncharacterized protein (TIRG00374 family)
MLVNALDIEFSTWDAIRIGMIGLFFAPIAFGIVGGDALRVFYAARHARQKLAQVICSVFADRSIGMLTMFTFASAGFWIADLESSAAVHPEKLKIIRYLSAIVATATLVGWFAVIAFIFSPKLLSSPPLQALLKSRWLHRPLQKLVDVVLLYRGRLHTLGGCVCWSVVVNLCFVGMFFLLAAGLNVPHPPLSQHFLLAPMSMAGNAVPLPGGIGGMELMLSYYYEALSTLAAKTENGIVIALLVRLMLLAMSALGGIAWLCGRKKIRSAISGTPFAVPTGP